jgi:catechol 2,3-dioxygenase-like lactoylglutathione lyase family enzyme
MIKGLWTIGIKVRDLEAELAFHRALGNEIVLDETLVFDGVSYRIPLIKMGDKYLHVAEKMVYERLLKEPVPYGIVHLVYRCADFDEDVKRALSAGAVALDEISVISAGFGRRRVAFMRAPNGWIFEFIEVIENLVPEV